MWRIPLVILVDLGLLALLIKILRKDWRAIKKDLANPETPKHIGAVIFTWAVTIFLFAGVGFVFTAAWFE